MTLKTLGKTSWEEIEVGEVFACESGSNYFSVNIKWYKDQFYCIDHSLRINFSGVDCEYLWHKNAGSVLTSHWLSQNGIYKLPLSVQRLWKEDY